MEELKDCEELKHMLKGEWTFLNKKGEARKHRTDWCAAANRYRCVRCGRSSKHLKIQGKCGQPKWMREDSKHKLVRWGKSHLGEHDTVRRVDNWVQKVFGLFAATTGTKMDQSMQAFENGYERKSMGNLNTRRGGPCQECERMEN